MQDQSTSTSSNLFAIDLYKQLKMPNENLFVSPFSIFTAITMMYVGARNETEAELRKILHITESQRRLPNQVKALVEKLLSIESTEIDIANSIWTDLNYELSESFLYIMDENYNGGVFKEDFSNIDEICNKVNIWVSENTKKKIQEIITPKTFDPSVKLMLLNAIYFNGIWEKTFKEENTNEAPFYLLNGRITPVPLMHQKDEFSYFEDDLLQVLELEYKGIQRFGTDEHYSMIIFLPKDKEGLESMENKLGFDEINTYIEKLSGQEVKIFIPRFKMETNYNLKDDMREMGMVKSFSRDADFSGIADTSKSLPPVIGEIIHKAFVEVNEEGTEAAAVTLITGVPKGMPIQREIPVFKADHPFIFIIQDTQSKTILFMGRLLNPKD